MPCISYYDDHPEQYFSEVTEPALKAQISFAESALCQTLRALETTFNSTSKPGNFYDMIDYAAAGITRPELVKWHTAHKELDAKHRAIALAKQEKAALKKSALAKLSAAERKALGVK